MPFKLFSFLFFLVAVTLFIGLNLENRCDISLFFYTFKNVPIFLSLLFAFVLGALAVVPFLFGSGKKKPAAKPDLKSGQIGKNGYRDPSNNRPGTAGTYESASAPEKTARGGIGAFFGFGPRNKDTR